MNRHLRAALVVVGITIFLFVGFWAYQEQKNQKAQTEGAAKIELQKELSDFAAKNLKGQDLKLSQYKGKIVILNFWASWCGPCVEEMPSLIRLVKTFPNDVVLLAVSGDSTKEDIDAFMKSFPEMMTLPNIQVIWDSNKEISQQYQVFRLPESFVVDKSQILVKKISGTIDWYTQDALEYMRSLNRASAETASGK